METETPISTEVLPSPTEIAEAPATVAEETAAAEPAPEAGTEPEPTPTEEVKPWAAISDPFDLLELEDLKPHLERREARIENRIKGEYQGQFEEATKSWTATEAHKQLAGIYGNILQKLEDADIDGSTKLIDRLEAAVEPLTETYKNALRSEGGTRAGNQLWKEMLATVDAKGQDKLEDFASNPKRSWGDVMKHYAEVVGESRYNDGFKKGMESRDKALAEKAKAEGRAGEGPNTAPARAGGERRPTVAEYSAATSEQRRKWREEEVKVQI